MADKWWKARERQIARFFKGERNPLSGGASRHTRGDVIHDKFYIEVKSRKRFAVLELWRDIKKKADKEKKIPIVCLVEKNKNDFWILVKSDDWLKL